MYRSIRRAQRILRLSPLQTCPLTLSATRPADSSVKTAQDPHNKHATAKVKEGDTHNVQERSAKAGMDANTQGAGGNATERKDTTGAVTRAKKEHPEAPDPAIGMQDERGGKGG